MGNGWVDILRDYFRFILPIIPSFVVAAFRLYIGWILGYPTQGQPPAVNFGLEFFSQTLVWAMVSLLTSVAFRVGIDRRVLFTGASVPPVRRFSLGGRRTVNEIFHALEWKVGVVLLCFCLVMAGMETARPGTTSLLWIPFLSIYIFGLTYLTVGFFVSPIFGEYE